MPHNSRIRLAELPFEFFVETFDAAIGKIDHQFFPLSEVFQSPELPIGIVPEQRRIFEQTIIFETSKDFIQVFII
jgi:hypothetical protein